MDFKNSKTKKNLMVAFAGESQARNKYTYFASQAKKNGYDFISKIFLETAENEKEHAKIWFKYLNNNTIPTTETNLLSAITGEYEEWTKMYKDFANIARTEGFEEIAKKFDYVANIEKNHEERFKKILDSLKNNKLYIDDNTVMWKCINCGHIHIGKNAPSICPVCNHNQGNFKKIICKVIE